MNIEELSRLATLSRIMAEAGEAIQHPDEAPMRLRRIYDIANEEWNAIVQTINTNRTPDDEG